MNDTLEQRAHLINDMLIDCAQALTREIERREELEHENAILKVRLNLMECRLAKVKT